MSPAVRVRGRFWRMLAPRWAHAPLSGEGAAKRGGRFNPPGIEALYMSGDLVTAIAEYEQDLGIRPGTLCAYQVDVAAIVDLCDPATRLAAGVAATDLACAWKHIALVLRQRPPTWDLAIRLAEDGAAGLRVPSVHSGEGINLVLWRWNDTTEHRVDVLDPLGDLPRDQTSWPR
jgi:RES domain-containing protein